MPLSDNGRMWLYGVTAIKDQSSISPLMHLVKRVYNYNMNNINSLFAEWQSLQPLKETNQKRLDQKFMLEFNYNSNHIEGNTLTYGQTELLLKYGEVSENAKMKDLEDMKAHNLCLGIVKSEASDEERPLTETFIRALHKTMLREDYTAYTKDGRPYTVHAGIYKTRPNSVKTVTDEIFEYASVEETPALMHDLVVWYNETEQNGILTPIELASLFHYRYIRIHPFEDGNGRISRLIVNYILAKHGYPMIVVKSDDKTNYLTALHQCDVEVGPIPAIGAVAKIEQIIPLVDYLTKCLERSLVISVKAARGERIEEEDDFMKRLKILEKNARRDIPENTHQVTIQDKIDVYNNFHRVLAGRLIPILEPVKEFFTTCSVLYYMSIENKLLHFGHFFRLDSEKELVLNMPKKELAILEEVQYIFFQITFEGVKSKYNMKKTTISIDAGVEFGATSYKFDEQSYSYGRYPTMSQIDEYIDKVKSEVLKKIQDAMLS